MRYQEVMFRSALILVATFVLGASVWIPIANAQTGRNVEVFQGPVLASSRVTGMGGAYIGVAEDANGHMVNPASFTVRQFHNAVKHFAFGMALNVNTIAGGGRTHQLSSLDTDFNSSTNTNIGFNLKWGGFGIGVHLVSQDYDVNYPQLVSGLEETSRRGELNQSLGGLGIAHSFGRDALAIGMMLQTAQVRLTAWDRTDTEQFTQTLRQNNLLFGVLYKPHGERFRIGATLRTPSFGPTQEGDQPPDLVPIQPEAAAAPWEIGIGGSWVFGPRVRNVPALYLRKPARQRLREEGYSVVPPPAYRRYVMVAADLIAIGKTPDAVSSISYLTQRLESAGDDVDFALRLGVESEVIQNWLQVRAGTYWEPSRVAGVSGRLHGTGGFDVKIPLGNLTDLRVGPALDAADQFFRFSVGLGFWH